MRSRLRLWFVLIVAVVALVANVIDGIDDGFSVWNWVAIACFAVVIWSQQRLLGAAD